MDIMIDLETLDTTPDATVLSIGAAAFSVKHGLAPIQYYNVLNLAEQTRVGRKIDPDTVRWWLGQVQENPGAIDVFHEQRIEVIRALDGLAAYYTNWCTQDSNVWANGPDFDCVILRSSFDDFGLTVPWKHYQHRCFRTFKKFTRASGVADADLNIDKNMSMHNALADAVWQAQYVMAASKELGIDL